MEHTMHPTSSRQQPIIAFTSPWANLLTLVGMFALGTALAIPAAYVLGPIIQVTAHLTASNTALITKFLMYIGILIPVWLYLKSIPALFYRKQRYIYAILPSITFSLVVIVTFSVLYGLSIHIFIQPTILIPLLYSLFYATTIPLISELIFRGVLQNIIHSLIKNIHAAIFITAFIGSILMAAISLQASAWLFLFNVGLGYLYWRTKHLMWPMLINSLVTSIGAILSTLDTILT